MAHACELSEADPQELGTTATLFLSSSRKNLHVFTGDVSSRRYFPLSVASKELPSQGVEYVI